jgi:hypothetical protein
MLRRAIKLCVYVGALGCGAMVAVAVALPRVEGSGVPATEERDIAPITHISFSGTGTLTVVQSDYASVKVTADDNILPYLKTETKDGKLVLRGPSSWSLRPKTKIEYVVSVPKLEALTLSGTCTAAVEKFHGEELTVKLSGAGTLALRDVTFQSLNADLSGAGKLTATGSAVRTKLKLSGAGQIDAAALRTSFTDVTVSGAGTATVWAAIDLKARVSGAGGVKYKGSPGIEQKVSGAGRVRPVE